MIDDDGLDFDPADDGAMPAAEPESAMEPPTAAPMPMVEQPAWPTPNERHIARLKQDQSTADLFEMKFGPGSASKALGIGTSETAKALAPRLDEQTRQHAVTQAVEGIRSWFTGPLLGQAGMLGTPAERQEAAESELDTARTMAPFGRSMAETSSAAAEAFRQSGPQSLTDPRMLTLPGHLLARGASAVAEGLTGAYATDQEKRLGRAERSVRGEVSQPQATMLRSSVDTLARSLVEFAAAKPVEFAGIAGGYFGRDVLGFDIDPAKNMVTEFGKGIENKAKEMFPEDVARQKQFVNQVSQGIGSTAAFYGTGMLMRLMGMGERGVLAGIAISGAAGNVPDEFDKATKALENGTTTEWNRFLNMMADIGLGATEALPFVGGVAGRGVRAAGARAFGQLSEEAGQEFIQQTGTNTAAKLLIDPSRDPYEGVLEGTAVAGITGGMFGLAMRGQPEAEPDKQPMGRQEARARGGSSTATDASPTAETPPAPAPDARTVAPNVDGPAEPMRPGEGAVQDRREPVQSDALDRVRALIGERPPAQPSDVSDPGTPTTEAAQVTVPEPTEDEVETELPAAAAEIEQFYVDSDWQFDLDDTDVRAVTRNLLKGMPVDEALESYFDQRHAALARQRDGKPREEPAQAQAPADDARPVAEPGPGLPEVGRDGIGPVGEGAVVGDGRDRGEPRGQDAAEDVVEDAAPAAEITDDDRRSFARVLAGKTPRSQWGATIGQDKLQGLIDEAVADGRLAMRNGVPRRTAKAKTIPEGLRAAPAAQTSNQRMLDAARQSGRLEIVTVGDRRPPDELDAITDLERLRAIATAVGTSWRSADTADEVRRRIVSRRNAIADGGQTVRSAIAATAPRPAPAMPDLLAMRPVDEARRTLVERLQSTGFKTIVEARKFAKDAGIKATGKALDEMIEQAVVDAAREIVARETQPQDAYQQLVALYDRQPNLAVRTSTSVANQAYSTPMPLAYVASRLAGVRDAGSVYEPSAGNGALLIEADPARQRVVANELEANRAGALKSLGFETTTADATDPRLAAGIRAAGPAGSVIMNPPFGAVREGGKSKSWEVDGFRTTQVDHAIALEGLKAMADDGRAVLILGGIKAKSEAELRKGYRGQAKREFYFRLYSQYNVVDHFTVSGDLYRKQGAGWPVDVVVINGRGKSQRPLPAVQLPVMMESWDALAEKLDGVDAGTAVQPDDRSDPGVGEPDGRDADALDDAGRGGDGTLPVQAGDDTGGLRGDVDRGEPGSGGSPSNAPGVAEQPVGLRDAGATDEQPAPREQRVRKQPQGGGQALYEPVSESGALDTLIPVNMASAARSALERIREKHGSLDALVADRLGYAVDSAGLPFFINAKEEVVRPFSAEQIDALAAAIDNVEGGAAFILGDQTGIGKGRVVAGMLRYAVKRGLTPVLVTEKPDLYGDMYRDLRDIGIVEMLGREPSMFMTNNGEPVSLDEAALEWKTEKEFARANGQKDPPKRGRFLTGATPAKALGEMRSIVNLEGKYDVVFTTYDQMNTVKGQTTPRRQFLEAIKRNALIAFDESHNAGGAAKTGWESKYAPLNRADFARELSRDAAGVIYSSATYAKRPDVMDLYARTDMGKAVDDPKNLPALIQGGGVPMQQVVATMLSDAGQYIRRERSFDGVEYAVEGVPVNAAAYRQFSDAISAVFRFDMAMKDIRPDLIQSVLDEQGAALGNDTGVGEVSATTTSFSSIMHNLISQMLLSIKADAVAQRSIEAMQAGEKPVIALANTNESFLKSFAEQEGIEIGQAMDLDFGAMLNRYLTRTLRVTIRNPDKTQSHYQIPIEDLPPGLQDQYAAAQATITDGDFSALPVSPIDWIRARVTQAGASIAEVTGRGTMIDYTQSSPTYVNRPKSEQGPSGKRGSIAAFNAGKLDVLILNRSGSTGVSMHASVGFKDQRRRRMILAQADPNIDTHLQMLGRVHRTGQIIPPAYSQVAADIPAEARPTAVLMRKMASLNANTTGARGSVFMADSVDFMNEIGDEVVMKIMAEQPELDDQLGNPLKTDDDGVPIATDAAKLVTGRLVLLDPQQQSDLLDQIQAAYKAELQQLDALGENPLEAKTLDLQAQPISSTVLKERSGDGPFRDEVRIEEMSVRVEGRAMSMEDVLGAVSQSLGVDVPEGDGVAGLNSLAEKRREWALAQIERVRAETKEWAALDIAALSEKAQPKAAERHAAVLDRWEATARVAYPGSRVKVALPVGEMEGIVLSVDKTGKARNPSSLGSWTVRIAVPDGMRVLEFPFSKLFPQSVKMSLGDKGAAISASGTSFRTLAEQFEQARKEGRETRYIVTGNILGGYESVAGKGRIVNFTSADGQIKPGVLMGRDFSLDKYMAQRAVRFGSGQQVARFMEEAPRSPVKSTDGNIALGKSWSGWTIELPASRAVGGRFYTDDTVRNAIAPAEFVKRGNKMIANVDRISMVRAIDAMRGIGATFETRTEQDKANEVIRSLPAAEVPGGSQAMAAMGRQAEDQEPEPDAEPEALPPPADYGSWVRFRHIRNVLARNLGQRAHNTTFEPRAFEQALSDLLYETRITRADMKAVAEAYTGRSMNWMSRGSMLDAMRAEANTRRKDVALAAMVGADPQLMGSNLSPTEIVRKDIERLRQRLPEGVGVMLAPVLRVALGGGQMDAALGSGDEPAGIVGLRRSGIDMANSSDQLPWGGKRYLVDSNIYTASDTIQQIARNEIGLPMANELREAVKLLKDGEIRILTEAFGGDAAKAKRWKELWNIAERDGNGPRAEKADAERAKLSEEATGDFDAIEIGDAPLMGDLLRVFEDMEKNPNEIADILVPHLAQLPLADKNPVGWTLAEAKAVAIMRKAGFEMDVNGLDVRQISRELQAKYTSYFGDPKDAEFMVAALQASIVNRSAAGEPSNRMIGGGQMDAALGGRDLDMSPEARKARAEAMGFDTSRVWYHGTTQDFNAFDPKKANRANGMPRATFLASDPDTANYFARSSNDGSRVIQVYVKRGNFFDFTNFENAAAMTAFLKSKKSTDIVPGYLGSPSTDGFIRDIERGDWGILERPAVQQWLKRKGFDGWYASERAGGPVTLAITKPEMARSVNAAFDPAESASPQLMAAFAGSSSPQSSDIGDLVEEVRRIAREYRSGADGGRAGFGGADTGAGFSQSRFGRALDGGPVAGERGGPATAGTPGQSTDGAGQPDVPRLPVTDRLYDTAYRYLAAKLKPDAVAKRRKAQGWNVNGWHGTTQVFDRPDAFRLGRDFGFHVAIAKPDAANERLGYPATFSSKLSVFLARITGGYVGQMAYPIGDDANIMPLAIRAKNPLRLPDLETWDDSKNWKDKLDNENSPGWLRKWVRDWSFENNAYRDANVQALAYNHKFGRDVAAELERRGYDSVIYQNMAEAVGQDSLFLWDAGRVRSAFDAFDDRAANDVGLRASDQYLMQDIRELANGVLEQEGVAGDMMFAMDGRTAGLDGVTMGPETAEALGIDIGAMKRLVALSLQNGPDTVMQTFTHEEIHVLRGLGLFTPEQWKVLSSLARKKPRKQEAQRLLDKQLSEFRISREQHSMMSKRAGQLTMRELYRIDDGKYPEFLTRQVLNDAKATAADRAGVQVWMLDSERSRLQRMLENVRVASDQNLDRRDAMQTIRLAIEQLDQQIAEAEARLADLKIDTTAHKYGPAAARIEDKLLEEVVAHAAADWADGRSYGTKIDRVMMSIRDFIEKIGNWLRGNGYTHVGEVFDSVWSGEVARQQSQTEKREAERRQAVQQWMADNDVSAMAVRPGDGMMAALADEPARLQRARALGFDTSRVLYHGTRDAFDSFQPRRLGGVGPEVVWLTPDARTAGDYTGLMYGAKNVLDHEFPQIVPVYVRGKMLTVDEYQSGPHSAVASGILEKAKDDGYAGVVFKKINDSAFPGDGGVVQEQVVIFDPANIRSVNADFSPWGVGSPNLMFAIRDIDTGRSMRADMDALGYRSAALEAARALRQARGTPEQMLAQLRSAGVKQAEIEATNLPAFMGGKKSITRDEIVAHLEANRVGLNEKRYGEKPANITEIRQRRDELETAYDAIPWEVGVPLRERVAEALGVMNTGGRSTADGWLASQRGARGLPEELNREIDAYMAARLKAKEALREANNELRAAEEPNTKWSAYSLDPSNPTYRETVLHLPDTEKRLYQWEWFDPATQRSARYADEASARRAAPPGAVIQQAETMTLNAGFRSGHFPEPNIVGHMMTSMTRHEGQPVYTIDQIQSDWGQKLRDGGVRDEAKISAIEQQHAEAKRAADDAYKAADEWIHKRLTELGGPDYYRNPRGGYSSIDDRMLIRSDLSRIEHIERSKGLPDESQDWFDKLGNLNREQERLWAEIRTAKAATPGNPLVNTTDQWTTTTLRRALRQAAEADAAYIAIPHGDTVLSYNPGDENGMRVFYGSRTSEGIVPKNLRKILEKLDKDAKPFKVEKLETTRGLEGWQGEHKERNTGRRLVDDRQMHNESRIDKAQTGFTLFPLTLKIKAEVTERGQMMFAFAGNEIDRMPEQRQRYKLVGGPGDPPEIGRVRAAVKAMGSQLGIASEHATQAAVGARFYKNRPELGTPKEAVRQVNEGRLEAKDDLRTMRREAEGQSFYYDIQTDDGESVGSAHGWVVGRQMYFDWLGAPRMSEKANLGLRVIKDLREQVRKDFPQVTEFVGLRVSGAREKADAANRMQSVTMFAFAGERAKTADMEALARAKQLEADGSTRDQIWTDTGWFRGVDGKWRFEIDDSGAQWNPEIEAAGLDVGAALDGYSSGFGRGALVSDMLLHTQAFDAYPWLAKLALEPQSGLGASGSYDNAATIRLNTTLLRSDEEMKSTLLHEGQHGIQKAEGFGQGANLGIARSTSQYAAAIERYNNLPSDDGWTSVNPHTPDTIANDIYRAFAGEVEARAVQKRMDMTPEERRARPPWLDYDVPEDQQIVRFADGTGVSQRSYSAEPPVEGFPTIKGDVMFAIRAFHGSPYDFDRFDLSKIGKGEGAQIFGRGLYFTEREDLAKNYGKTVSLKRRQGNAVVELDGVPFQDIDARYTATDEAADKAAMKANELLYDVLQAVNAFNKRQASILKRSRGADVARLQEAAGQVGVTLGPRDFVFYMKNRGLSNVAEAQPEFAGKIKPAQDAMAEEARAFTARNADLNVLRERERARITSDWMQGDDVAVELGVFKDWAEARADLVKRAERADLSGVADSIRSFIAEFDQYDAEGRLKFTPPESWSVGRIYEVEIKADESEMLLWDRPLDDQPQRVKEALKKGGAKALGAKGSILARMFGRAAVPDRKVDQFVTSADNAGAYVRSLPDQEKLRRELVALGIKGIKYLDRTSRWTDNDGKTFNYVVFDDSLIEIVAKDGKPIETAERQSVIDGMIGRKDGGDGETPLLMASLRGEPLDMSTEARKARAEAMGFDTGTVWYHGTTAKFDAFEPSRSGSLGPGVYLTERDDRALGYAPGGRAIATYVRGRMASKSEWANAKRSIDRGGQVQREAHAREVLEQAGYAGVRDGQEIVVFDPANIRSVNAAFDTQESASPLLMASLSGRGSEDPSLNRSITDLKDALGIAESGGTSRNLLMRALRRFWNDTPDAVTTQGLRGLTVRQDTTNEDGTRSRKQVRLRPRANVQGQFDRTTGVMSVRSMRDIKTIAHEGGHSLEMLLGTPLDELKAAHWQELVPSEDMPPEPLNADGYSGVDLDTYEQDLLVKATEAGIALQDAAETGGVSPTRRLTAQAIGTLIGGALGAGIGVAAGNQVGGPLAGAAAGTVGAIAGIAIGSTGAAASVRGNQAMRDAAVTAGEVYAELVRAVGRRRADQMLDDVLAVRRDDVGQYVRDRYSATGTPRPRTMPLPDGPALSEAFARWMERYVMDAKGAREMAPNFFEAFEDLLDAEMPGVAEAMHSVQTGYQQYATQSSTEQMVSDLVSRAQDNAWERMAADGSFDNISGNLSTAYNAIYDDLNPIAKMVQRLLAVADRNGVRDDEGRPISLKVAENPYKLMRLFRNSFNRGRMWLERGIADLGTYDVVGPSLRSALEVAFGGGARDQWNKGIYQEFGTYLVSKRAVAEYKLLAVKTRQLEVYDEVLEKARNNRSFLAGDAQQAKQLLDRREDALIRAQTRLTDGKRARRTAETAVRNIEQRLRAKADQVLAAQMARDRDLEVRRKRELQALEREARAAVAEFEAARENVDALEIEISMLDAEIEQRKAQVDETQSNLDALDAAVEQLRTERQRTAKRGANRPPTLESREQHEKAMADLEAKYDGQEGRGDFREASRLVAEWTHRLLTVRYQAGFISEELYRELSARKDWYVPFQRDMTDASAGDVFFRSGSKKWSPFKKFNGSDRALINPLEVLSQDAYNTAQQIAFNEAVASLVGLAERAGPGGGVIAERVPRSETVAANESTFDRIRETAIGLGIDPLDAHQIVQRMEQNFSDSDITLVWAPDNKSPIGPPQLPLWVNGERQHIRLNDPVFGREVFNALNGLGEELSSLTLEMMAKPARWLRTGITTHPNFILRNLLRDIPAAFIRAGVTPFKGHMEGLRMLRNDDTEVRGTDLSRGEFIDLYNQVGGIVGGQNVASIATVDTRTDVLDLRKSGPMTTGGETWMGYISSKVEAIESAGRLGIAAHAYRRAIAHNPDLTAVEAMQEAAFVARDVYDWGRRGSKMLAVNRVITFLNAALQGTESAARGLSGESDRGVVMKGKQAGLLTGSMAVGVGAGSLVAGPVGGALGAMAASKVAEHLSLVLRRESDGPLSANEERQLAEAYKTWFRMSSVTLFFVLLYAMMRDDPWYEDIKDGTKSTHSWVKLSTLGSVVNHRINQGADMLGIRPQKDAIGEQISKALGEISMPEWMPNWLRQYVGIPDEYRIPKPFEWAILGNVAEMIWDRLEGRDPRAAERIRASAYEVLAPPGVPQAAELLVGLTSGYDIGRGRPIVGGHLAKLAPHQQFDAYASELAIDVSKGIYDVLGKFGVGPDRGISPKMVDWVLSNQGAYWGKDIANLYGGVKRAGGLSNRENSTPYDLWLVAGVTGRGYRNSKSIEEFWKLHGQEGGKFQTSYQTYRTMLDQSGDPAGATEFLTRLPPEERAYALLKQHFRGNDEKGHPLERVAAAHKINQDLRKDMILGRLTEQSRRGKRDFDAKVVLSPAKQTEVHDILERLSQIEVRNAMIVLEREGWKGRPYLDPEPVIDELKASSPEVYELFEAKRSAARLREWSDVRDTWPKNRDELLKNGAEAALE